MIAAAALQEDVDAVGISILSGAHNTLCPRIVDLLRENGMDDTLVLVGGIVPQEDIAHAQIKRRFGNFSARNFDRRHCYFYPQECQK